MQPKKSEKVDLTKNSSLYFVIGLSVVLFVSWQAIEWKTYKKTYDYEALNVEDDDDGKMIVQMGIKGAKASHVRNCLAEKSGYGDIPPGTRDGLKAHLTRTSSINSETGAIVIKGQSGNTELAEDTWRTAGDSQKFASGFGQDMRDCITEKVKK